MAIRDFFGFESKPTAEEMQTRVDSNGDPSPAILPPAFTNRVIGPKEASKIGSVYRAVNIISTMTSQMSLKVYRGQKEVKTTPALVRNPIEGESQASFVQQVVWSLALWGNCYIRVYGDPVSSVDVLDPDTVVVTRHPETGKVAYYINGKETKNIRHLKFERLPGALLGHGPLTGSEGELKAAWRLDEFQRTWFDTTGVPKGVLKNGGTALNAEKQKEFITAWNEFIKGNAGTVILPNGMDYETVNANPIEVQYVQVAEANIRNIARIFGIPAANMFFQMDGNSMTYTNQVEANLMFLQNTLTRYMVEIEAFFNSLLPGTMRVEFDEEELMRLAPEKLWAMKKLQSEVGYYSGAEQREAEGLPALPEPVVPKTVVDPEEDANGNS